ncbi:hypothetical protein PPL_02379 [Heterostelium album PN500]|uniref:S5 DRBM domain-containing protein n=1 Tax=Heterostelium pallidum (strain ATCC 26659 / Pp 5 / PN500) TaxID=670386 RepID=D3AZJ7_HETP5|nr:hypothetical protein PPL_02379 [Heterostelium album PN500]EFA85376.1 hypothetical protein PPL_02379 [Heterostelium album PN500]|eukprot:XP_020437485.1 hypothetical protein PPL_02379 [Heterostelium album PN500]
MIETRTHRQSANDVKIENSVILDNIVTDYSDRKENSDDDVDKKSTTGNSNGLMSYSKSSKKPMSAEEADDIRQTIHVSNALDEQYQPNAYSGHYVRDPHRKPFKSPFSPKDVGRIRTTKQMLDAQHNKTVDVEDDIIDDDEQVDENGEMELGDGESMEPNMDEEENEMNEHFIVDVGRHVKVTKGGRINSFSTLVFIGNGAGTGGLGYGKGETAGVALQRASRDAERNAITINRYLDRTLPSGLDLKFRSTKIRFFKTGMTDMSLSGEKQDIILESLGLHGVDFRTYGRRSWRNIFNEKRETLRDLMASNIPNRQSDPYNFGLVGKFLYDLEKPIDREQETADLLCNSIRDLEDDASFNEESMVDNDHSELERGTVDPMSRYKRKQFIASQKVEDSRKLHTQIRH